MVDPKENSMSDKKIYLLPKTGNLYKANLHCHSTVSDGSFTPEELKKMYMEKGYHAIAYTDHRACVPHTELTDSGFVALTGIENAFGIGRGTSVHICGISRDPLKCFDRPDVADDGNDSINRGIRLLSDDNFITTLNHPRWSGISAHNISLLDRVDNIEIVNGYEMIQDGYGNSSAIYELELRRGRRAMPIATDDSHRTKGERQAGHEYFRGFTMLTCGALTYDSLIGALDSGSFFASTGPILSELWLDGNTLHIECSPVSGIYVHGSLYKHRAAVIEDEDTIRCIDIDLGNIFADSDYIFVQAVDTKGNRAWSVPYWFNR